MRQSVRMTQTRKLIAKIAAAVLLGAAALAVGGWIGNLIDPPLDVTPQMGNAAPQMAQDGPAALPGSADTDQLSSDQQSAAEGAADRVCEGFTAQVPLTTMEQGIAQEGGMSLAQAHDWVAQVLATHCQA